MRRGEGRRRRRGDVRGRGGGGRVKGGDIAHTDVHTVLIWVIVLNDCF